MTTIDQSTAAQIAQPIQQKEKFLWLWNKPVWMIKKPSTPHEGGATDQDSFYRRAIEWSHRADKVINLVLGYLLAVASVLGFMDVLSGGEVLGNVPYLFYIWLGIMGLGVEFQIFLVIGRMPDLSRTVQNWFFRLIFFAFNVGFLAFLCYMSVVIAAVFTQHRDVAGSTIAAAMTALGIEPTRFVFERAALATLLLVLMAIDRTMERWRMQIDQRAAANQNVVTPPVETPEAPGAQIIPEEDKFEKMLTAFQNMNEQNMKAMQATNEQNMKAMQETVQAQNQQYQRTTIEQLTRVTLELVDSKLAALPEAFSMPLIAQQSEIADSEDFHETDMHTDEIEAINDPDKPLKASINRSYKDEIQNLLAQNPDLSNREIAALLGCTERTVYGWKQKLQPLS